jgi:catechol 2,3-dioxygenase-like lactoylglutathione lyase family enzyme
MTTFAMAMLVCSNLERSRDFYRDVVGLKVRTNAVPHWVDFELEGGFVLGLHPASGTLSVRPGSLQLVFHVANVDAFVTDARTAGVRILQDPFQESFARLAVIADPDGYPVQVGTPKH